EVFAVAQLRGVSPQVVEADGDRNGHEQSVPPDRERAEAHDHRIDCSGHLLHLPFWTQRTCSIHSCSRSRFLRGARAAGAPWPTEQGRLQLALRRDMLFVKRITAR